MSVSAVPRITQPTTCLNPRSVTYRTASLFNSSDYRVMLMSTCSWAIFDAPEMSKKGWAYQLVPVEALKYAAR